MAIAVNFAVVPDSKAEDVLEVLNSDYSDVNWVFTEQHLADFTLSFGNEKGALGQAVLRLPEGAGKLDISNSLSFAIRKGQLILPTALGREVLKAKIDESIIQLKKLRDNNPMGLKDGERIPDEFVFGEEDLAVHLVHGTAMKAKCPALEETLSSRCYRVLQRNVPGWRPVIPMVDDPLITDLYPTLPLNGEDLRARLEKVSDRIVELGVTPSVSLLDHSQLNLGIPTPGGMHRKLENLQDPDETLKMYMKRAAEFMVHGLADVYLDDPNNFENFNTRVGVKVDNYQGAILNTRSHTIRQTLWSIMLENGHDIFYFSDLYALCVSGFRSQSNGAGKKRPSYVSIGVNKVAKSRAIDGEDLDGKPVAVYDSLDATDPTFVTDPGYIGGRKRVVANVESAQNDALLPVPSYLAATKDTMYKWLYQQDLEILSRFVSGSGEFKRFWREGYEAWPFLREQVKKNFDINTIDEFIEYIVGIGEVVLCGDVMQYDASATWTFVKPFLDNLLSKQALELAEKSYNSDKIGVYTDHNGIKRFYFVTCSPDPSFPDWYNELVLKTRDIMSSLPSGQAITAQNGRGPMRAVLDHLGERSLVKLGFAPELARECVLWESPRTYEATFSFSTAFMNDGGDDHNLGMLVLHLLTGEDIFKCSDVASSVLEEYEFLRLLPEYPKMNCGFKFHDDEKGRCIAISLSEGRMVDNTLYPEYPRSALGLNASLTNYMASSVDTPAEEAMHELAHIIAVQIYGFDSLDDLAFVAGAEEQYMIDNPAANPARQQIALLLGIPENDLEWQYSLDELLALGIDESLLNMYRKPIPAELTRDPGRFFNMDSITKPTFATSAKK